MTMPKPRPIQEAIASEAEAKELQVKQEQQLKEERVKQFAQMTRSKHVKSSVIKQSRTDSSQNNAAQISSHAYSKINDKSSVGSLVSKIRRRFTDNLVPENRIKGIETNSWQSSCSIQQPYLLVNDQMEKSKIQIDEQPYYEYQSAEKQTED